MNRKEFVKALKLAQKLSKSQKQVKTLINSVLIEKTGKNSCNLYASNVSIKMKIECNDLQEVFFNEGFVDCVINPDVLIKYISKFKTRISTDLNMLCLNSEIRLEYSNINLFPVFISPDIDIEIDDLPKVCVDSNTFIRFSKFIDTSNETMNPMFKGISFKQQIILLS